jgi:hypothetical protein
MATGRTVNKYTRVYVDGYDLSGYSRAIGPLTQSFAQVDCSSMIDSVKGFLPGQASLNIGALNAIFDNTATSGILAQGDAGKGTQRTVLIAQGIRAAPAIGDPAFAGQFLQLDFATSIGTDESVTANMPFAGWSASGSTLLYDKPWGVLLHANEIAAAANTSGTAGETSPTGAATAFGGYAVFMLFSSAAAVTLSVEDSVDEVNGNYSALLISSGALDASVTPKYALVALARNATVKKHTRWQASATGATFAIAFIRGLR